MTCSEFLRRYSDYDDSLLSAEENAAFRAHMAVCASCARYDRVLRKGRMLARQLPQPEPSPEFFPSLHRRLEQTRRLRREPQMGSTGTLAAASVLLAAVSAVALLHGSGAPDASAEPDGALASAAGRLSAPTDAVAPIRDGGAAADAAGAGADRALLRIADARQARPRQWMAVRVDRAVQAAYSPLVTGPPLYRAPPPGYAGGAAAATRRAID